MGKLSKESTLSTDYCVCLPQSEDEEEMMMQQAIALSLQRDEPSASSARQDSSVSSLPQDVDLLHLNDSDDDNSRNENKVEEPKSCEGSSRVDSDGPDLGTEVPKKDSEEKPSKEE
ncbi:hypothetical protein Pmar_PMAR019508 [Perkinsus marinus ATCC 50983]|uniref:Uncharacterized protein n=1 Tax=Perkinsus marinus (strain ATCC 50983 / TXsc) TaxID=423536 RepID=C5KR78_PERM5|nr:hypothetical protein Pmar_PMAR019508 [Perkinsus marinus ATCC 50983]EER12979.1 hypothetical protein Pmar_PMAR019508 [Perkinsus marinus ATCC 50983]|eukprot:XP_002781184.1 hypothetical protein Pmar_PMAR019508 [Perkinsus marinus ATCC 50983]